MKNLLKIDQDFNKLDNNLMSKQSYDKNLLS